MFVSNVIHFLRITFMFIALLSPGDWEIKECKTVYKTIQPGRVCWAKVTDLRPSQFSIGEWEVQSSLDTVAKYSTHQLNRLKLNQKVPANVSPKGEYYIVNRHHAVKAIHDSTIPQSHKWVYVEVLNNWSSESQFKFFKNLIQNNHVRLLDAKGLGPLDPALLPKTVKDLQNDPFRSMASIAKVYGCFKQTDTPYEEFLWADFFRSKLMNDFMKFSASEPQYRKWCVVRPFSPLCLSKPDTNIIEKLLSKALELCDSPDASTLPGFYGTNTTNVKPNVNQSNKPTRLQRV